MLQKLIKDKLYSFNCIFLAGLALLLTACGGGASSSGGGTSTIGIVPAPGSIGPVLYADATVLRPTLNAGTWTYRGTTVAYTGATPLAYTDTVSQSSSGTGVVETSSNMFNTSSDTLQLLSSTSQVTATTSLVNPFTGKTISLTYPEISGPVHVGDQVTIYQDHQNDSGIDVDGDGKHDAVDFAIYRLVVGTETVNPPNLPSQQAVRIDTIALARFSLSSTGNYTPIRTILTQSTWYAPNLGIVRQRLTTPISATDNKVADETLINWDGVTQGWGYTAFQSAVVPAGTATIAGAPIPSAQAVATYADHALILTEIPGNNIAALGYALHSMNTRGQITSTAAYFDRSVNAANMLITAVGQQLVAVAPTTQGKAFMNLYDNTGKIIGNSPNATLDLSGGLALNSGIGTVYIAGEGSRVWVGWVRDYTSNSVVNGIFTTNYYEDLVVRAFDVNGKPLTPEILLESGVGQGANINISLSAANGSLTTSYVSPTNGQQHIAVINDSNLTPVKKDFQLANLIFSSVLSTNTNSILFWLNSGGASNLGSTVQNGVLFDSSINPILAAGTTLDGQVLTTSGTQYVSGFNSASVLGNIVVLSNKGYGLFWSNDATATGYTTIASYQLGNGSLAAHAGSVVKLPVVTNGPSLMAQFADRIIILSDTNILPITSVSGTQLQSSVVWLH